MSRASIGDYVVTSKLGSGSFAIVYKGYHKTSKVPVAIKVLSLYKLNRKLLDNLEMEITIMRQIDHPNIVKLYEIKKTQKHMYLVLEYCAGGDLQQFVRRTQEKEQDGKKVIPQPIAQHFLRELAKGMQCLWQRNLIHRDLKPQNLLLVDDSPTSVLKIADFGFARHLATTSMAETLCGSPLYMAPEILKFQKYDAKADLWSVGTILYEMLAGRPPYGGANHVQLLANIERQPLRFPPTLQLSSSCRQLLTALLQRKPALRLGFAEFFADPFVDLPPLPDQVEAVEAVGRSSPLLTAVSIREEEEEEENKVIRRLDTSIAGSSKLGVGGDDDVDGENAAVSPNSHRKMSRNDRCSRVVTTFHEVSSSSRFASTAPSATMRQSRSGNLEVMETAFASASSGSGALRRSSSSRLARSRRTSSSGSGLSTGTSSKLSPQMSPQMSPQILPSPSPRINPFKQLSESPPGAAALQQQFLHSGSFRVKTSAISQRTSSDSILTTNQKHVSGGGHTLDSSEEYVLVDGLAEKPTCGGLRIGAEETVSVLPNAVYSAASVLPLADNSKVSSETLVCECGQQLIDIMVLRTQAIAPIADQLWALSAAGGAASGLGAGSTDDPVERDWSPRQAIAQNTSSSTLGGKHASGVNFSSVFSMSSSLTSSVEINNSLADDEEGDDDDDEKNNAEGRYVCAAEALVLYVKCLRLVRHVVLYLRQEQGGSTGWTETSRKVSMAFLSDQLTHFLGRAEKCKAQVEYAAGSQSTFRPVASQEQLLYAHALRIGRQGAIREVLGHVQAAHDYYLQALLLLESLLMDTPGMNVEAPSRGRSKECEQVPMRGRTAFKKRAYYTRERSGE
ncbi:unnamed protein product [Peronospora belbahrii]|uniref:Protein kinase domain-containing protein n=1 Tax=Peronospora belbahrii TaxID=622444 RepID=A0ABN8CTX6_9STRA|nr:unnamed protein product [Peronospora belbahrii]